MLNTLRELIKNSKTLRFIVLFGLVATFSLAFFAWANYHSLTTRFEIQNGTSKLPNDIFPPSSLVSSANPVPLEEICKFEYTDIDAALREPQRVCSLYLEGKNMTRLPAEIGKLTNLITLSVTFSSLRELPREIGKLKNLHTIRLHHNELKGIPAEIGNLVNLQELSLGVNRLGDLPGEIGKLDNLQLLDLGNNELRDLPVEIGGLTKLTKLNVSDNKLTKLPLEISKLASLGIT